MKRTILGTVAVALLLVTAGCAGFVGDTGTAAPADGGATPADDAAGQPASAGVESDLGAVQPGFKAPTVRTQGNFSNYTALYTATIDSVVEVGVETARGQSQGSGFVYSDEGYIVTNQHVVSNADEVTIRFRPGVIRAGEVVGTDVYTDLAVVEVGSLPANAEPLPLADDAVPGQPVAAMGSPFGLQGSITHGIVSGTNRSMPVAGGFSIPDTVQTDAPINPGNSGGPLVSMNGKVLGVNRATAGDNIGFAISSDVVEEVVPAIIRNGSYDHAYLGVGTRPLTPATVEAMDLNVSGGLVVAAVLEGGPADGELQPAERTVIDGQRAYVDGDVIVAIGDQPIESHHELARYLLFETQPGEEVAVTVIRDGERVTETIELGERPNPQSEYGF